MNVAHIEPQPQKNLALEKVYNQMCVTSHFMDHVFEYKIMSFHACMKRPIMKDTNLTTFKIVTSTHTEPTKYT